MVMHRRFVLVVGLSFIALLTILQSSFQRVLWNDDRRHPLRTSITTGRIIPEDYRNDHQQLSLPSDRSVRFGLSQPVQPSPRMHQQQRGWIGMHPRSSLSIGTPSVSPEGLFLPHSSSSYCALTNPLHSSLCFSQNPKYFNVVTTVAEVELVEDPTMLEWLLELPIDVSITIYVKSNWTVAFRRNHMQWGENTWTFRRKQSMWSDECEAVEQQHGDHAVVSPCLNRSTSHVFRSMLRDSELIRRLESRHFFSNNNSSQPMRSTTRRIHIVESPNVGDEAHSVTHYITHADAVWRFPSSLKTDQNEEKDHVVIFLHAHRDSWHSGDIVARLRCLCVDPTLERYRTLTFPDRAYFFQCMPLLLNASEILENARALARMKKSVEFERVMVKRALESISVTENFATVFSFLFQQPYSSTNTLGKAQAHSILRAEQPRKKFSLDVVPRAIIRDCCAMFLVTHTAMTQHSRDWWRGILDRIERQPEEEDTGVLHEMGGPNKSLRDDAASSIAREKYKGNKHRMLLPFPLWELSMKLERFWRTIFQATEYDQHRDLSLILCEYPEGKFYCPIEPFGERNISFDDLVEPFRSRKKCISHQRNVFRLQ